MSTSYKNTFNTITPNSSQKLVNNYAHVKEVRTQTGDIEIEGTIAVITPKGESINIVFPFSYNMQQLPLIGEIVAIYQDDIDGRYYYSNPINIHNFPTHNSPNEAVVSTPDYIEPDSINPYKLFTGDTIFQGRFGQSLRFTQTIPGANKWSPQEGTQGNSVVILSSGQIETPDGSFSITEDANLDAASLYLIENSSTTLTDSSKRDSYENLVENANTYLGNQAVLSSGRLFLNAKQDSILLSAQSGSVGLSGDTINIDGITSIRLDAPSYNLNANTFTTTNQQRTVDSESTTYNYDQFVLNGTNLNINHTRIGLGENAAEPLLQSTEFLADITALNASLTQLATALSGITALLAALPGGQVPAAALQTAATAVTTQANSIQTKAASGNYLSTTVFTK